MICQGSWPLTSHIMGADHSVSRGCSLQKSTWKFHVWKTFCYYGGCVLLTKTVCLWTVVVYYYGKILPQLRGSVDVSTLGITSPRLGCRPREIGFIYHKGALVINGPRRSPSLIMTRNNMDLRCLRCFPSVSQHHANIHSWGCTYGEQPWLRM